MQLKTGKSKQSKESSPTIQHSLSNSCFINFAYSFADNDLNSNNVNDQSSKRAKINKKYYSDTQSKLKQIKVLTEECEKLERKIGEVKKPKMECYAKKKEAQNKVTKSLVKSIYKYFEKHSEDIPVKMMEVFIGCLRGIECGRREDVEIYLKNQKGLLISMNKLEESKVNREHAKVYTDVMKEIKHEITEVKEYSKFIPFYVWMDNVIRIIKYEIEEKHLREELKQKEDTIFKLRHDIDKNQIILDHCGINPDEYNHFNNLSIFWKQHLVDLQKLIDDDEDDLNEWDNNHMHDLENHMERERDEDSKQQAMKADYPVFGSTPVPESKAESKPKLGKEDSKGEDASNSDEGDEGDEDDEEAEDSDNDNDDEDEDENEEESTPIESEDISVSV